MAKPVAGAALMLKVDALLSVAGSGDAETDEDRLACPDAAVGEMLVSLRRVYVNTLRNLLAELRRTLADASRAPLGGSCEEELRRQARQLHRIARLYGFDEVGDGAALIENRLETVLGDRRSPPVRDWRPVERALVSTQLSFDAAPADGLAPGVEEDGGISGDACRTSVLLVDSDTQLASDLATRARSGLLRVVPARTAEEAMTLVNEQSFDCAFVGVLGEASEPSVGLIEGLLSAGPRGSLPVGAVGPADAHEARTRACRAGALLYLGKPVRGRDFLLAARHLAELGRGEAGRALVATTEERLAADLDRALEALQLDTCHVDRGEGLLGALEDNRPDLLLLDAALEGAGADLCRLVRSSLAWRDLPVLLLAADSAEARIEAFEAGASDLIPLPIDDGELRARLRARMMQKTFARGRAERDPHTGLLDPPGFVDRFGVRLAAARRQGGSLGLALVRLDELDQLAAGMGAKATERAVTSLARLVSTRFRTEDLRGRWAVDTFAVGLVGPDRNTASMVIARLLDTCAKLDFYNDEGFPFHMSLSAGVVAYPEDGHSLAQLVDVAAQRLRTGE